ncbi:UNVERIFIED_CONTAM: hypothetical protein ABIC26_000362 [Paenibacillus sp. PvR008]
MNIEIYLMMNSIMIGTDGSSVSPSGRLIATVETEE